MLECWEDMWGRLRKVVKEGKSILNEKVNANFGGSRKEFSAF